MSVWDTCPRCAQLGVDEPSIYDAIVVKARKEGRDVLAITYEFFTRYHEGHQETSAA